MVEKPKELRYADRQEKIAVMGSRLFAENHQQTADYLKQENFFVVPLDTNAIPLLREKAIDFFVDAQRFDTAFFNENSTESTEHLFDHIENIHAQERQGKKILFMCTEGVAGSPTVAAMYLFVKHGIAPRETANRIAIANNETQIAHGALQRGNQYQKQAWWRKGLAGKVRKQWRKTWFHKFRKL